MNVTSLSERLKSLRKEAGLSLKQLAAKLGYSKAHVANVESARSQPSRRYLERFAAAFGMTLANLLAGIIPMRRFRRPRLLNQECRPIVRAFGHRPPPVPLPALGMAFRTASHYLLGPSLLQGLNSQSSRPAPFWDAVKQLAGHLNGLEQVALLHLLDVSSELHDLHPHRLGLRRTVVDDYGRRWLAVVLRDEDDYLVLYPQLQVLGESRIIYCLDFLAAVRKGGRTTFIDIELDGRPWHPDARRDEGRARDLNLPTIRFDQSAMDRTDFRHRVFRECWRVHDTAGNASLARTA